VKIISIVLILMISFISVAVCATADQRKIDSIRNINFSPDGKKLIFNRYKSNHPYMIQTYNMDTGELVAYESPNGERWDYPQYSFNGECIVFVTVPLQMTDKKDCFHSGKFPCDDFPINSQIAIMDKDGKNVRKITNTTGIKIYPSFSHSGRKIIFARADTKEGIPRRGWNWSVNEVDLKTGKETCLTQFKFILMSRPYYFPDDKTFIFWADYLTRSPGMSDDSRNHEDFRNAGEIRKDLESKYQHNSIYVMQANQKELRPYLVMPDYQKKFKMYVAGSEDSRSPSLSADGSALIFESIGYKPDGSAEGWQLYQYSADGNHRQITHFSEWISDKAVSPNGELIAVIHGGLSPQYIYNIVIYQVSDGIRKRAITLPDQPSQIINSE
jgi:Tol biopolymer transport system component